MGGSWVGGVGGVGARTVRNVLLESRVVRGAGDAVAVQILAHRLCGAQAGEGEQTRREVR